ncbi:MAG: sensor histidine kinase [Proteobacteria bacterium]|nr:sensor histidine kinase [Pseudomonadota bacterium]
MTIHLNSLRARLTTRIGLALAVIGVLGTIVAYTLGAKYANLVYDQTLFDDVTTLAGQASVDKNGSVQLNLPTAALKWLLAAEGEVVIYRVTDLRTRKIVAENGDLGNWPDDPVITGQPAYRDVNNGKHKLRVAYTRRVAEPRDVPVLVEIGETTGKRDRMTRAIFAGTALFMAIMISVALGLVWRGVATALAPLKLLEAEATQRSATDLKPLDSLSAPEEVRGLIESINRLMARVSSVIESQSHFIANAAHQLRTPLAGLRLQVQLASKATQPEAMRSSLAEIEASAARATRLIEQLLVLSRAEATDSQTDSQIVDLGEISRQVIERYLPLADKRRIDLGYEGGTESRKVAGNDVLFAELLGNLVDNALRYGREGGRVTVETRKDGVDVLLAVSDDGGGFAETDREQVFQRFYRPDSSPQGGAGLGLAIVREIVERYRGNLTLESAPGHGSRFELRFADANT